MQPTAIARTAGCGQLHERLATWQRSAKHGQAQKTTNAAVRQRWRCWRTRAAGAETLTALARRKPITRCRIGVGSAKPFDLACLAKPSKSSSNGPDGDPQLVSER